MQLFPPPNQQLDVQASDTFFEKKEPKKTPEKLTAKNITNKTIIYTFYITFVFLTTTATITFIEAIRTNDPYIRHIMNLESCISIIASFFYYIFITKLDESSKKNKPVDWRDFTLLRYTDWSITTPFMLLSISLFLAYNIKVPVKLSTIGTIWLLNYIMLLFGFLGEIGQITRLTACIAGFIPFILMFFIIYIFFIKPKFNMPNTIIFYLYAVVWSLYGCVYMFSEEYKNIIMNILDLISKCLIGIGMWMYFTHIIRGS